MAQARISANLAVQLNTMLYGIYTGMLIVELASSDQPPVELAEMTPADLLSALLAEAKLTEVE